MIFNEFDKCEVYEIYGCSQLPGELPGEMILDYWTPGNEMLADPIYFLHTIQHYKREDIKEEIINKLKNYVENPNFQPAKVNIYLVIANYIYFFLPQCRKI